MRITYMEDMEQVLIDYCHNMPDAVYYINIHEAQIVPYKTYLEYKQQSPRFSGPVHCIMGDVYGSPWPTDKLFHEWLDDMHKTLTWGGYLQYGSYMKGCNHYLFVIVVPRGGEIERITPMHVVHKLDWSRAQAKKHCYGVT